MINLNHSMQERDSHPNIQGDCYYRGISFEGYNREKKQDYALAFHHYTKAANRGDEKVEYRIAKMLLKGRGVEKNADLGFQYLEKVANNGLTHAQFKLGSYHFRGNYIPVNLIEATRYFGLAAEKGHSTASRILGFMYYTGHGVEKNFPKAFENITLAAENGDSIAQSYLGSWLFFGEDEVEKNCESGLHYLKLAAEQGDVLADKTLSTIYYDGLHGIETNYKSSLEHLKRAYKKSPSEAAKLLGLFYLKGNYKQVNILKAAQYFKEAEEETLEQHCMLIEECFWKSLKIEIIESNEVAKKVLLVEAVHVDSGQTTFSLYGGTRGNAIFQRIFDNIVLKELIDYLKRGRETFSKYYPRELSSQFFRFFFNYIDLAAKERNFIAKATETPDAELFGRLILSNIIESHSLSIWNYSPSTYLSDPVPFWPKWQKFMKSKIKAILLENISTDGSPCNFQIGDNQFSSQGKTFNLNLSVKQNSDGENTLQYLLSCLDNNTCDYKWENKKSADEIFTFSTQDIHNLELNSLSCLHKPTLSDLTSIAYPFLSAFFWNRKKDSVSELKSHLAEFCWHFSHSSVFSRGQAAITEWLIKAIIYSKGFTQFQWPDHWQVPPDQQALSTFSLKEFVEDFMDTSFVPSHDG